MDGFRGTGNLGTYENLSSKAEFYYRLDGLTEGAVTIEVGSLFQNLMTCIKNIKKDIFLQRPRLGPCISQAALAQQANSHGLDFFIALFNIPHGGIIKK